MYFIEKHLTYSHFVLFNWCFLTFLTKSWKAKQEGQLFLPTPPSFLLKCPEKLAGADSEVLPFKKNFSTCNKNLLKKTTMFGKPGQGSWEGSSVFDYFNETFANGHLTAQASNFSVSGW